MHLYCSDPVRICSSTEEYANVGGVDNKLLCLDLLAIHMVRNPNSSTIISYHHDIKGSTSAEDLFTRLKLVGRSVYWLVLSTSRKWEYLLNEEDDFRQNIVRGSTDPTFVFLALLWSALYAWDEALEYLYSHFCWLVS